MKPLYLPLLFILATLFAFKEKNMFYQAKSIENNIAPISESVYAAKYEVSNIEYRTFLADVKQQNPAVYQIARPDTAGWRNFLQRGELYDLHYFNYAGFNRFPVVNIGYEGAQAFCQWLTDRYMADPKRKFKKVVFRLPTEAEWLQAARGNENWIYPWGTSYTQDAKGKPLCNYKKIEEAYLKQADAENLYTVVPHTRESNRGAFITASVASYVPNKLGLYNMSGNVAEMLAEKGKYKGGSFASTGYHVRIDVASEYDGNIQASPCIGFRYFMEIIAE